MNAAIAHVSLAYKWAEYTSPAYRLHLLAYVLAPIVAGVAIYICRKWSFWLYIATMLFISVMSYYGYRTHAGAIGAVWPILLLAIDAAIVSYFFLPAVRTVYFDPRLRWWETLPRYRAEFPGRWSDEAGSHPGEVANFSAGGLFFKSADLPADESRATVAFEKNGVAYAFKGRVILHSKQNSLGFGFKFDAETAEARSLAKTLAAEGRLIAHRAGTAEDGFFPWLKNAAKGKGLVPQTKRRD